MTVSVPPSMAKEYRRLAKEKGENSSEFFREIFTFYKRENLIGDFRKLQEYGSVKTKEMKITEDEIEKLVFSGR
jgi:hypothetical protein